MLQLVVPKSIIKSPSQKLRELEMNASHWAAELWVEKGVNTKVDIKLFSDITITIEDNIDIYIDIDYSGEEITAILWFNKQERMLKFAETKLLEEVLNQFYELTKTPEILAA